MKPGHKTTEFVITVLTDIGLLAAAVQGSLSPRYAALAAAVSTAAYSIARGLTKLHGPVLVTPVTPTTAAQAPPAQQ